MRTRPAARILLLDQFNCVLLFKFSEASVGRRYWATPGGAVEKGETFEQAALRELREETGLSLQKLGSEVGRRSFELRLSGGEIVWADERFFAGRTDRGAISDKDWSANEREVLIDHHWWPVAELRQTSETIFPDGLVDLLDQAGLSQIS